MVQVKGTGISAHCRPIRTPSRELGGSRRVETEGERPQVLSPSRNTQVDACTRFHDNKLSKVSSLQVQVLKQGP